MDLLDLGKLPISDAKPAGDDARYEPEYDELQQEIDKLSNATGGEIDWKHVVRCSFVILSQKSKDIKIASYLGVALIHLKGVGGLSTGAQVLLDLVKTFWDDLYPAKKRMRGRFNAVGWWVEQAEKYLSSYGDDEVAPASAALLLQRLKDLDAALADKSEDAPMLNRVIQFANGLPLQAPEVQAAEEAEARVQEHMEATDKAVEASAASVSKPAITTPAPVVPAAGPAVTPAPVGNINSHDEYRQALKGGLAGLSVVADYLMVNDPADRTGYRIRRIVAWLPIPALPPSEGGKTLIPPPDKLVKDSLMRQQEGRDFVGVLEASESRVGQYLFWLDLSRLTAEALDGLGGDFVEAKLAVEAEVRLFAKRLSGIENMTFSDGTPFADNKTKAWLRSLNKSESADMGAGASGDSVSAKAFAEASKLAKAKKVFDAVTVLQNSLYNTAPGRERFLIRLGMVRLLTDVDQSGLAHAHVEELLDNIKEFRLEQWEPDLALRGFRTAYEALMAEGGDEAVDLAKKTLQRIGRLNPAAALKINGLN